MGMMALLTRIFSIVSDSETSQIASWLLTDAEFRQDATGGSIECEQKIARCPKAGGRADGSVLI